MHNANPLLRLKLLLLLPLLLALSVTGCATNSPPPTQPTVVPSPPAIGTPLPSVDYSISVRRLLEEWRKKLKDTQTM